MIEAQGRLLSAAAEALEVPVQALMNTTREQPTTALRFRAYYIIRAATGLSWPIVGECFGRDHSTVMHGYHAVAQRMKDNVFYARPLEAAVEKLRELFSEQDRNALVLEKMLRNRKDWPVCPNCGSRVPRKHKANVLPLRAVK